MIRKQYLFIHVYMRIRYSLFVLLLINKQFDLFTQSIIHFLLLWNSVNAFFAK